MNLETQYERITELVTKPVNLMEVCGTHTVAISRFGLRSRLPKPLRLLSGPGCPVCVTPTHIIDTIIALSRHPNITIATFGDMMRVPGSESSLQDERANGSKIHIFYSPLEAIVLAQHNPDREIVLVAVGFETTLPVLAATIIRAHDLGLKNFSVVTSGRLAPPAMAALMQAQEVRIDGFICPGHVSAVIGSDAYEALARDYHVPCVVTGFEPTDIVTGIRMLLEQHHHGEAKVETQYTRAVNREGNRHAITAMQRVFRVCDAAWRGIGLLPQSGVELTDDYKYLDAVKRFNLTIPQVDAMPQGCECGVVMRGLKLPNECGIFGTVCTPQHPVGPCMVSTEGACAAYYRYDQTQHEA